MHAEDALFLPPSISSTLRLLHKQRRDDRISHLQSIHHDVQYVRGTHERLGQPPLLANLRCGIWYAPPDISSGHCYFKSTDGHVGAWDFSLSRLNLQVALTAASSGAVVVVDSTRSGKSFPDSLTKTLPIWCCVINRAVAAKRGNDAHGWWDTTLRLPTWIPESEASQIEARIGSWVSALCRPALAPVLERLVNGLDRPLRPSWLSPKGGNAVHATAQPVSEAAGYAWVYCVCASEVCTAEEARERASYTYIQGAGDDEENWARGLTAQLWWRWHFDLIEMARHDARAAEDELTRRLEALAAAAAAPAASDASAESGDGLGRKDAAPIATPPPAAAAMELRPPCALFDGGLLIGARRCADVAAIWCHTDAILDVGGSAGQPAMSAGAAGGSYLHLPVEDEGVGCKKRAQPSKDWWQRVVLPKALCYLHGHLMRGRRVIICCERGDDRSATVAAAASLALYDETATSLLPYQGLTERRRISKEHVRARLALLQASYPEARISRGLTKELNNFFVAAGGGWARLELRLGDGDSDRDGLQSEQFEATREPGPQPDAAPPIGIK